ncbi:efflux RND transporter periplasmic adaptor subunit [Gelidibacter maritimus]|uniref:Efflux RND transporter periplasmic adaptor subunit n=1 Tax=Gelidibacter maritimus TaxID=2761487 RepID=A0A7W2M2V6_9FLAO|nr:efflux RND transporter periplasmic adaptor subunit [Gelidibacter maritimus]MBA6151651.1 efflux RND transporter periplasmic adaptor subunit [Gelidibacter maritimus]
MKQLYILFVFMLLVACGNDKNEEQTEENLQKTDELVVSKEQFKSEQMEFGTLSEHDFNTIVKVSGQIEVPTQNQSSVSTFLGGYVTKSPMLIGDEVKKGQFLVTLESTEFVEIQQRYLEVAQQLNFLKSEFIRQKTLYDENISSEKNFLKAESDYKSSLAHYNGLKKKLQMLNINPISVENGNITSTINLYAPIDGFVTKVNVSNGTYVSPADIILEIINTHHIHLELSVFEKDILKVKKGQKIEFRIPEASDSVFKAEVHLVGTSIDPTNRRVVVHGHIDDDHTAFIVGMFAEADIFVGSLNGIALPKTAVIQVENDYFALILEKETSNDYYFTKVKLDIGLQTEDVVEVLNAASLANQKIVVNGTYMLLNEAEGGGHSH